jgi:hypothetical protein
MYNVCFASFGKPIMTSLDLSGNRFGNMTGAVDCIVEGAGNNFTLLQIDLSRCGMRDGGVATLARNLGSPNSAL